MPEQAADFLRHVLRGCGLEEAHYRFAPLYRRLKYCLRALGAGSIPYARAVLDAAPDRWPLALEALLIGTTEFFRDQAVFDDLRWRALPPLLSRRGIDGLDVWSAGCSDGAELYSVAVLLAEAGGLERGRLLGTDCRRAAIDRARRARYHPGAFDAAPADLRQKYFREHGGMLVPVDKLSGALRWEVGNLLAPRPPESLDLILCRNVAIYLQPAAGDGLWSALTDALRPGGVLVAGRAERPTRPGLRQLSRCIYVKSSDQNTPTGLAAEGAGSVTQ